MAILQINPDNSDWADFENDHFYPNFDVADHPRRNLLQSYDSFRDE